MEITRSGENSPITISVDAGNHRLKVTKEGFEFFTQDFSIDSSGEQAINAKLVPLEEKSPVVVVNTPPPTSVPAVAETSPTMAGGRKALAFETPGFDQWVKVVVALPADEQVKAVAQKTQELNPGFDGTMQPTIGEGIVLSIAFISDHVTDISPLRAFTNLSFLECNGSEPEKGMLSDLSPIKEMPLRMLSVDFKSDRHMELLRSIGTLETINLKSAADFWKEVEAN